MLSLLLAAAVAGGAPAVESRAPGRPDPAVVKKSVDIRRREAARKALADDRDVVWLDFNDRFLQPDGTLPKAMFPDELHPNADGYRIWCDAVMPRFEKYAGRK